MKPLFTFSLVLFIFTSIVILLGCKKSKNTSLNYTSKMGGMRNWHGHYYEYNYYPYGRDTSYNLADLSFAISIENETTVHMFSNDFSYCNSDSANGIISFCIPGVPNTVNMVIYYFKKDSVVYFSNDLSHNYEHHTVYYTY